MRKTNVFLWLFVVSFCTTSFLSCNKDEGTKLSNIDSLSLTPRSISKVNGILSLGSYQEYYDLVSKLKSDEDTQIKRNLLYSELNINRNDELNDTDNPACLKFEQQQSFSSLRATEEKQLFDRLEAGDEDLNSIISDPYFKTLVNPHRAIKIGNRILIQYETGINVIIANNDLDKYSSTINQTEGIAKNSHNVRVISSGKLFLDKYFDFNRDNHVVSDKLGNEVEINQNVNSNNEIILVNNSFVEYSDGSTPTYQWKYQDGSSETAIQPTRTFSVGDEVDVVVGNPSNDYDTTRVYVRACGVRPVFPIQIDGRTFKYSVPNVYGEYTFRWLMGDGTTLSGLDITHTYANSVNLCNIMITLQAIRPDGSIACEGTFPLIYEPETCDKTGNDTDKQEFSDSETGDGKWRIDCKIWVDNGNIFTPGDVGSRSKSMKKGWVWYGKDAQQIWISLEGDYLRKTPNLCNDDCTIRVVPFEEENEVNSGNVQRNISDSKKVRYEEDRLWSTHRMKVNGRILRYTKNGGFLFLD